MKKKIFFLTASRADFGKLKSLIKITKKNSQFKVYIIITGMHMIPLYGNTYKEIQKFFSYNLIKFRNQNKGDKLEVVLNKTIKHFSRIVKKIKPDLIILHGDRVETLACALVGSLNHILTAHIEGGELSGTIDDTIRHAVTKLCHIHFVGNEDAKKRIIKMGEHPKKIFNIGSPDMDIIFKRKKINIGYVKRRYEIKFKEFAILIWHSVTSELKDLEKNTKKLIKIINNLDVNFVVIYPNNDPGSGIIINCYKKYLLKNKTRLFKSLRFENFITLLKNSKFIIGNSSCAIYEAPALGIPSINIGTRQKNRLNKKSIKNLDNPNLKEILMFLKSYKKEKISYFGKGNTDKKFIKILKDKNFWDTSVQKYFNASVAI
jgi:UDP-N-acetylglucosamine 2-epimerase (hydrolysing)